MKSQNAVNYRQGNENESCLNCQFFQPPESCSQVKGVVSPGGLCELFMPKGAEATPGVGGGQPSIEDMLFGGGVPQ